MSRPCLSVIIATYNRLDCLSQTLDHLHHHLPPGVEVIVIDDGSTDQTSAQIPQRFPWLTFLRSKKRQGPGVARNLGLKAAQAGHFMALDSDCFIVPETLDWLVQTLKDGEDRHLLMPCRSFPQGKRSVENAKDRPYTYKDLLLKTYGEVIPVLAIDSLKRLNLSYPKLFAGGEPLMFIELSRHEPLYFVDRVVLEYRTDLPLRISSAEYQLRYALEIATVFEAYLPFLDGQADPELRKERARVLEKAGAYFSLGGATRQAGRRLLQALAAGRPSALAFLIAATLLPKSWLSRLFREYRQLQLGGQVPPDHGKGTKLET